MKTWVKLYTETNRDPKIGTLTWAQRGIWAALLALAGELDVQDEDGQPTGYIGETDDIAWRIRCDGNELAAALVIFEKRDMVHAEEPNTWYVTHFHDRQQRPPSDLPEASRERQKRHREGQNVSRRDMMESRPVTASDSEAEAEAEQDSDSDAAAAAREGAENPAAAAVFESEDDFYDLAPFDECADCLKAVVSHVREGGFGPSRALSLALEFGPYRTGACCADVERMVSEDARNGTSHVRSPSGLLVTKLRQGDSPPVPTGNWFWQHAVQRCGEDCQPCKKVEEGGNAC